MLEKTNIHLVSRLSTLWRRYLVASAIAVAVQLSTVAPVTGQEADPAAELTYAKDVAPILKQYCAGCHGAVESEAELRLDSYQAVMFGSENGSVIEAGNSAASKLIQVVIGGEEPRMPPEDEPQPTAEERRTLQRWVDGGALPGLVHQPDERSAVTPHGELPRPVVAATYFGDGRWWARGGFGEVHLHDVSDGRIAWTMEGFDETVTALAAVPGTDQLLVADGVAGHPSSISLWQIADQQATQIHTWSDHDDAVYAIAVSQDGNRFCTAGYDRKLVVRNVTTGELLQTFEGHNGAIYDLAMSADGDIVASASADATIKIWHVPSGRRLDTLSQPLREQYTVDLSPDGEWIAAGGADSRIRLWRLVSREQARINPLLVARFGHEGTIHRVRFTSDSRHIVSIAEDRELKIWDVPQLRQVHRFETQPASTQTLAIREGSRQLTVGRMDGTWQIYRWEPLARESRPEVQLTSSGTAELTPADAATEQPNIDEVEPNDLPAAAQPIDLPVIVRGKIDRHATGSDQDGFRFHAEAGATWIFEVHAARKDSPLDSMLSILDDQGQPVPRVQLQAIRDSYFTFRGKNSEQTGDFRLHNWEEMKLNQYLYAQGEVVKLYHYPRGPDSGFNVYPNTGKRFTYFDTTAMAHALNEPSYVVEPFPVGTPIAANGLPLFTIYYENDDAGRRDIGSDSRLTFVAPATGDYQLVVRDVRGFGGSDFEYELEARRPQPRFEARIEGRNPTVGPGSGVRFGIQLERFDGFDGPVDVTIDGVVDGMTVSNPIRVERGHLRTAGTIFVDADAAEQIEWDQVHLRATAVATIGNRPVTQSIGDFGEFKYEPDKAPIRVHFAKSLRDPSAAAIEIQPGSTTTAAIWIDRQEFAGRVGFGSEEAVWNMPHGVYVDNTGLNGVLIVEQDDHRMVFITAEPWVEPCERWVFIQADTAGQPTSLPIRLRVTDPDE